MKKYNTPVHDLSECPHCGSDFGYYRKMYISGWSQDVKTFDGEPYNYGLFDSLGYSRYSSFYYCVECDKKIAKAPKEREIL